jgi:DNA-binding NtrC family response regulator
MIERSEGGSKGRVLVVDDDAAARDYFTTGLETLGFEAVACPSGESALEKIQSIEVDVVATDLRMKGMSGLDLCRKIKESRPDLPVLVLTAFGDYAAAVEAVRAGAYDFLSKPVKLDTLELSLDRAVERRTLHRKVRSLEHSLGQRGFRRIVGESAAMKRVYELLSRVAPSDTSVLVTGESGTGKELVARAIHVESRRSRGPFVAINCAAVPESLLEAELFGYERGAFTDAKASKPGLFAEANGGTLFLDEVGELPVALQSKLLRALQERVVRPLGGKREVALDFRLVTATNRDLETAVEEKRFREDLYFRINVVEVGLPPLRARGEDVVLLANYFLRALGEKSQSIPKEVSPEARAKLVAYSWPGNVRELENVMERALALGVGARVEVEDLPDKIVDPKKPRVAAFDDTELVTLEEVEKRHIFRVLEAVGGNRSLAAKTLGLDRTTLWRKLDRLKMTPPKDD